MARLWSGGVRRRTDMKSAASMASSATRNAMRCQYSDGNQVSHSIPRSPCNRYAEARRVGQADDALLNLGRAVKAFEPGAGRFGQRLGIEGGESVQRKRLAAAVQTDL